MHSKGFSFSFGMGVARGTFHFPFVPNVFPFCSHQVLNEFTIGSVYVDPRSQHVPQCVPNSTSLLLHMLWQILSYFPLYQWAKGEEL
jgi:hypothetical protein